MAGVPTIDNLISSTSSYLKTTFYPSGDPTDQRINLDAIVGNIFNEYTDPCYSLERVYTSQQMELINDLIRTLKTISVNTPNFLTNYGVAFSENIATSGLTTAEQAEIFIPGAITGAVYVYFFEIMISPTADWTPYLDADVAVNLANLANIIIATFKGTLIGAKQSVPVLPTDAAQGTGLAMNIISAVGGGITGAFAEVVFHWEQRPKQPCA